MYNSRYYVENERNRHIIKLILQAIGVHFVKMIDCYNSAHAKNIDHPEKYTLYKLGIISICIGYWIHKSAIILHEFVVLPEVQPSAKKHKQVQYTGARCTSMYLISDLLHLLHFRNAILIGKQKKQPSA